MDMEETTGVCPICGNALDEKRDKLTLKWYGPRRWWVLNHQRDGEPFCGEADKDGKLIAALAPWGIMDKAEDEAEAKMIAKAEAKEENDQ